MLDSQTGYTALRQSVGVYARTGRAARIFGRDHVPALLWALAKSVEFAEPGQLVESLALDTNGDALGSVLVFLEDNEALILDETKNGIAESVQDAASQLSLEDVSLSDQSSLVVFLAVEGRDCCRFS